MSRMQAHNDAMHRCVIIAIYVPTKCPTSIYSLHLYI